MANTPEYTRKAVDNYRKKFDIMQLRLPKGTRERIEQQADKVHDFVVTCVLSELERLESPTEHEETHQIEPLEEQTEETTQEEKNPEDVANNDSKANPMTLDDVQALINQKRAKQKELEKTLEKARQERKEQEKAEMKKVINEAIESIRNQEEEQ